MLFTLTPLRLYTSCLFVFVLSLVDCLSNLRVVLRLGFALFHFISESWCSASLHSWLQLAYCWFSLVAHWRLFAQPLHFNQRRLCLNLACTTFLLVLGSGRIFCVYFGSEKGGGAKSILKEISALTVKLLLWFSLAVMRGVHAQAGIHCGGFLISELTFNN